LLLLFLLLLLLPLLLSSLTYWCSYSYSSTFSFSTSCRSSFSSPPIPADASVPALACLTCVFDPTPFPSPPSPPVPPAFHFVLLLLRLVFFLSSSYCTWNSRIAFVKSNFPIALHLPSKSILPSPSISTSAIISSTGETKREDDIIFQGRQFPRNTTSLQGLPHLQKFWSLIGRFVGNFFSSNCVIAIIAK